MKKFGPLFIIIAALLWSLDGLLRRSLYTLPSSVIVFYEHLIGIFFLLPFANTWIKEARVLTRKDWSVVALIALFSGALGTIFYTAALGMVQYIQYSVVVLLQQLQPIWAIAAASLVLKEKVTPRFLMWAGLALVAAYFISFPNLTVNLSSGAGTVTAALFALLAGMLWGSSTALSKFVLNKVSYITATALRFALAPLFALMFVFANNQSNALFQLTQPQLMTLIMITLSTGLVALGIYYYGLKKVPARVATICELVWPASAIFIDYFYFDKGLVLTQLIGVGLLLFCIYQVTKKQELKSK